MAKAIGRRLKTNAIGPVETEAMVNLLMAADHVRQRFEKICAPHGITQPQYNVLRILRGVHPDGHPRCEIMRRLIEHAPDVTRLVDRLERQGLVVRDRSAKDRRLSLTRITPAGLALLEKMEPDVAAHQEWFASLLPGAESEALSALCERVYAGELEEG